MSELDWHETDLQVIRAHLDRTANEYLTALQQKGVIITAYWRPDVCYLKAEWDGNSVTTDEFEEMDYHVVKELVMRHADLVNHLDREAREAEQE